MSDQLTAVPVKILLVEDSPGDIRLTKEALKESKVANELITMTNGQEAVDYLYRRGRYADATVPDIILLDLNLPRKDGREVLKEIKSDKNLKKIPVVVLTISKDEQDILKAYDLHANCYITKPIDLEKFIELVRSIEDFWLTIVKLPGTVR